MYEPLCCCKADPRGNMMEVDHESSVPQVCTILTKACIVSQQSCQQELQENHAGQAGSAKTQGTGMRLWVVCCAAPASSRSVAVATSSMMRHSCLSSISMQQSKVGGPARSLTVFCTFLFFADSSPSVTLQHKHCRLLIDLRHVTAQRHTTVWCASV